jgi:ATP-dependent DNA ligase
MDGRYANAIVTEEVLMESRQGEITLLGNTFDTTLLGNKKRDFVLNGELIIRDVNRYESNGIIASIISINKKDANGQDTSKDRKKFLEKYQATVEELQAKVSYVVWDIISLDEYNNGFSLKTYKERLSELESYLKELGSDRIMLVEYKEVKSLDEATVDFYEKVANNEEGTVLKGLSTQWRDGKHDGQIKVKLVMGAELLIKDYNQGKPNTRFKNTLGSLQCQSQDGLLLTDPAGITDEMRDEIWNNRENLLGTVVEVQCSGISRTDNGYSMLHPRFIKLRDDKVVANTLDEIIEIENSIKQIVLQ